MILPRARNPNASVGVTVCTEDNIVSPSIPDLSEKKPSWNNNSMRKETLKRDYFCGFLIHPSSGQYVQAFQTQPDNPLHSLCVGLTFFHMASQKYVAKRQALVLQVCRSPSFSFTSVLCFSLQEMCLFRVSPSFGGTWSCAASARRACTTWAERCTSWASHI